MFTTVNALASIKRNVTHCLTSDAIHRACRAMGHAWRERDLGPAVTVHAFLLQVLHGNLSDAEYFNLLKESNLKMARAWHQSSVPPAQGVRR